MTFSCVNVGIEGEGVGGRLVLACLDELEQSLGLERVEKHDLHLGRGLLDRDELCDPLAGAAKTRRTLAGETHTSPM